MWYSEKVAYPLCSYEHPQSMNAEQHPLKPFLPHNARILMLGSFPPPRKRWSMDFFYPNMQNDMWRIFGWLFFADREYFIDSVHRRFDQTRLEGFLKDKGVALYDTARSVVRLQDNASDKFLEVVEKTDVAELLRHLPRCVAVVTTGQKATDTLRATFHTAEPSVGSYSTFQFEGRSLRLYRMPSSSRAYPLKLEKKAEAYGRMMREVGLL